MSTPTPHRCPVLVRDDRVIGMAFLAIVPPVPRPPSTSRAPGDVQCVYVVPEERNGGLGGQPGPERAVVHSSTRAVTTYRRHGFAMSPQLMQADLR